MFDHKLHTQIDEFLAGGEVTSWLAGRYTQVFLRKGRRWLKPEQPVNRADWLRNRVDCIDLANIKGLAMKYQLQGIFPALLDHLEAKPIALYIECVHPVQLDWYFERRGYCKVEDSVPFSYYRLPDTVTYQTSSATPDQ